MKVYGASVSYYTGKLETYLRYKGIDYERASPYKDARRIRENVGTIQHPMVEREDGRWMSDTTPILLQLEREHPEPGILPENPVVRFVAQLIEDYADEWLWRAAMHYRWSYEHDRELLSRILTDELTSHLKIPRFLRRQMIKRRQRTGFVLRDGVTEETRGHVESGYRKILTHMSGALSERPFLLGQSPSIADFGLMGPMLRHFGQDPTPADIMRDQAPLVFDWLGRMWNARHHAPVASFVPVVPDDLLPLLQEVCETHLVQLTANALAYHADRTRFDMTVQGCDYKTLPVSRYRVYCLEQLREAFDSLGQADRNTTMTLLPFSEADVLWQKEVRAASGYDEARQVPFNKAINVFENGVPS
ncbi:MAG: glutathione S-transferase family protein [Gammaproteobacteria bacterium]|jgi:glutathione S-transferase|nr:glutathione S-transferase family protein [Gammaproteobacteria bacterium]MBT4492631.1 glutathione S-transferase family protein [Gammaproteobacteria bacterium]MBT7370757.1 glutathione S-transferase family protein [Gammaproteobacteria bacterium]